MDGSKKGGWYMHMRHHLWCGFSGCCLIRHESPQAWDQDKDYLYNAVADILNKTQKKPNRRGEPDCRDIGVLGCKPRTDNAVIKRPRISEPKVNQKWDISQLEGIH